MTDGHEEMNLREVLMKVDLMRNDNVRRGGFTLIELLVVVSIITVLLAILLPSLGKARERAKETVCMTHIRAWGQGFLMYASDFSGRLPLDGGDGSPSLPIGKWDDQSLWFNGVVAYTAG